MDGEETHLKAALNIFVDHNGGHINTPSPSEGVEIMKFAASASKIQQPCDVSPSYMILKQELKRAEQAGVDSQTPKVHKYKEEVVQILRDLDPSSRQTFSKF
jgi:hypothetical protein